MITQDALHAEMDAAGIDGYVIEIAGEFYIPIIIARVAGRGNCGRWLDSLPRSVTIKIPAVFNARLAGMLTRRGFVVVSEYAEEFGERVEVHVRWAAK